MKSKISITVDKEVLDLIENLTQSGKFRNRSHVVEYSVKKFIENFAKQQNSQESPLKIHQKCIKEMNYSKSSIEENKGGRK